MKLKQLLELLADRDPESEIVVDSAEWSSTMAIKEVDSRMGKESSPDAVVISVR